MATEAKCVNTYVTSRMCSTIRYAEIIADLQARTKSKKIKNPEQLLSNLRCLSAYDLGEDYDETLLQCLVLIIKDCPDQKVERKVLRTCFSIISSYFRCGRYLILGSSLQRDLAKLFRDEISSQLGSRLCLSWRMAGIVSLPCQNREEVVSLVQKAANRMEYPGKAKKSLWGQSSADKAFETRLGVWTATMSALRRTDITPPDDLLPTIFTAASSNHAASARHAFAMFRRVAAATDTRSLPNRISFAREIVSKMHTWKVDLYENGDLLCVTYLLQTLALIADDSEIPMELIIDAYTAATAFSGHRRYFLYI